MLKFNKRKDLEIIKGTSGLFCWLFWCSLILNILIYIGSIIVLFLNPHQLDNFDASKDVFLGFYNLNPSDNNLYLNWLAYLFGIAIIVLTVINCLMYWLFVQIPISNYVNKRYLMVLLLISTLMCILIFLLNIFNKPLFSYNSLSLINNGWNLDVTKNNFMNFNYVYDINFLTDGAKNLISYLKLNSFSVIWIILIISFGVAYITDLLLLLYNKRCSLSIITYKEV